MKLSIHPHNIPCVRNGKSVAPRKLSPAKIKMLFVSLLLAPLFLLLIELFTGKLGAQPSEEMNHELGEVTYRLLAVNLIWGSLIALNWVPAWARRLTFLRRHLGVVTFAYAALHVVFYVLKEGDPQLAIEQVAEKTYLILGFAAWLILLALALTSANWAVRLMGKNWKRLHRLAYLAILLATVHFALIEKKDWTVTLPMLVPLALLYTWRIARRTMGQK